MYIFYCPWLVCTANFLWTCNSITALFQLGKLKSAVQSTEHLLRIAFPSDYVIGIWDLSERITIFNSLLWW